MSLDSTGQSTAFTTSAAMSAIPFSSVVPADPLAPPLIAPIMPTIDWAGNRLSAARDLGELRGNQTIQEFVGEDDQQDLYRFQLAGVTRFDVTLTGLAANVDLRLIQDANANGEIDQLEILATSDLSGIAQENIAFAGLNQGTYFIQVVAARDNATDYQLQIASSPTEPGAQPSTATELGLLTGQIIITDRVDVDDRADFYRFRLEETSDFQAALTGLTSDADLYLMRDANQNGQIDRGEIIRGSFNPQANDEQITFNDLAAGQYFLAVRQYQGSTDYRLRLSSDRAGNTAESAKFLDGLTNGEVILRESIGLSDPQDTFEFYLNTTSDVQIALTDIDKSVTVALVSDIMSGTTISPTDRNQPDSSLTPITFNTDTIEFSNLPLGQYYLRINSNGVDRNYGLRITSQTRSSYAVFAGTLGADRFALDPDHQIAVISAQGNIDFGRDQYDVLDLTDITFDQVQRLSFVGGDGSTGQLLDIGNGVRVFDALVLNNGQQVWFEGLDRIEFADRTIDLSVRPNDPLFRQQWNLHMMGVHNAWRFGTGSRNIAIGIADSGVAIDAANRTHFDVRAESTFFVSPDNLPDDFSAETQLSHSTSLQTIITGTANNGQGIAGINWNADVLATDVLGGDVGDLDLTAATAQMIQAASDRGQKLVINLSLGRGSIEPGFEQLIDRYQDNVLFVLAAGNDNVGQLAYPAILAQRYRNVISVGAVWGRKNRYGQRTTPGTRISYPGQWGSSYGAGLSLMGPAEVPAGQARQLSNGAVVFSSRDDFSGTSAAAPNVAGVASLVWSANERLNAPNIREILETTAYDLGDRGYDEFYGHGLVNAEAAVRRAIAIS